MNRWHEIAKEGYPPEYAQEYLLTDGEDYFIGYWRPDANAWDNSNSGWVRKYYDGQGKDDSLAVITHWMELPKLPSEQFNINDKICNECKHWKNNECFIYHRDGYALNSNGLYGCEITSVTAACLSFKEK